MHPDILARLRAIAVLRHRLLQHDHLHTYVLRNAVDEPH